MICPFCSYPSPRCFKTTQTPDTTVRHRCCLQCNRNFRTTERHDAGTIDSISQGSDLISSLKSTDPDPSLISTIVHAPRNSYSQEFDQACWQIYPKHRRINKAGAYAAWLRLKPEVTNFKQGLQSWIRSKDWTKENGQYVPYPEKFIKKRMWEAVPLSSHLLVTSAPLFKRPLSVYEQLVAEAEAKRKARGDQ